MLSLALMGAMSVPASHVVQSIHVYTYQHTCSRGTNRGGPLVEFRGMLAWNPTRIRVTWHQTVRASKDLPCTKPPSKPIRFLFSNNGVHHDAVREFGGTHHHHQLQEGNPGKAERGRSAPCGYPHIGGCRTGGGKGNVRLTFLRNIVFV
jgi:hypothetical protein